MLVVYLLLGAQVLLVAYFLFFAFYNYLYSLAAMLPPRGIPIVKHSGKKIAVVIVSFNERKVIADTIKACEKLSYKNKIIIVGDDSNDGRTYPLLKGIAKSKGCRRVRDAAYIDHGHTEVWESRGFVLFHRKRNDGFKAGNLKELESYLKSQGYEYMYLLDADWWPQQDALERCLEVLEADPQLAFVQTQRRSYHGRQQSLQRCLAINEDGCYHADLPGRQRIGDPILFTGCCTLFRLKALHAAEGFTPGHLTEDIDLTNRLYLLGYKARYLEYVVNEGEVPPHYPAYLRQQERWAMGSARTFDEYLLPILKSKKLSVREKLGLLRQNAYFTPAVAIEVSILLSIISVLFLSAGTDNYPAMLYRHYLGVIGLPYTLLLFVALASNFVPHLVTILKKRTYSDLLFVPYATWLSWSLLHTFFAANIKGFAMIAQDWALTPKTNRKRLTFNIPRHYHLKALNLATLGVLIFIYGVEWYAIGWIDIYAFFWVPAVIVGIIYS